MIYLGADHAGFGLKEEIKKYLKEQRKEVEDLGVFELNADDDYPDFIAPVAKKVAENLEQNKGIVLGGSGQGEAIVANKVKGIRAAVYYGGPLEIVELSRQHNNANILSLGARFLTADQAKEAALAFLETAFDGGRHKRRIEKIDP
ncbi:MAG: ribose 5-phosphate isomerase B [Parcubacteria group bacterium Greene0714_21]|nr:MAG: ribose 5-phosphate isomerase B [Parcubacteria group bacterium Greene0416_39]TSC97598.1 MAG: ribose 5-phosphate isomerase B [Parcubacteria group bacterium Greene1014_47]TSD04436.1 MAG: ribose 5-phosphate isomerase B [Parcubacteria group bacterium Greene0714_21]